MRGRASRIAVAALLLVGLNPVGAYAQERANRADFSYDVAASTDAGIKAYDDDSILVVYRDAPGSQSANGLSVQSEEPAGVAGATEEVLSSDVAGQGAIARIELPEGVSVDEALGIAQSNPEVAYAQPVFKYRLLDDGESSSNSLISWLYAPNDPVLKDEANTGTSPNQWWAKSVHAQEAWDIVRCEGRVTVAVLDTGINFDHPDLKSNILRSYAWDAHEQMPLLQSKNAMPSSSMDHGSHVAGIVSGVADNGVGIAGISYNANILPICVFQQREDSFYDAEPMCDDEDLIRAYEYLLSDSDGDGRTVAQETNTRVVNMSLGGYLADDPNYEYDYAFEAVIAKAQDAGILTVAAGGNGDGFGNPRTDASYPSDYDDVVSVVALKSDTERAAWSDYSDAKDVSAPGVDIYSTWYYGDSYTFKSGTSMAAPVVSGVAALLWAYNPNLTVEDVKHALYSTADDLGAKGKDQYYGWGRVNALSALQSLGTASVTSEKSVMVRTSAQHMSASSIASPDSEHAWQWSVVDPDSGVETSCASIDDDGVLVARKAGEVEVRVVAKDDPTLVGTRLISIDDIAIDGPVRASAILQSNGILLNWSSADGATGYRVLRSQDGSEYHQVAFVGAHGAVGEREEFQDATASPSVAYSYRVTPVGELDGETVDGVSSEPVTCSYSDKTALRSLLAESEGLIAQTVVSEDGAEVPQDQYWATSSDKARFNEALRDAYVVYYSSLLGQDEVNEAVAHLQSAEQAFSESRQVGLVSIAPPDDNGKDTPDAPPQPDSASVAMLRLYNPNSGEHFYTASEEERDSLVSVGWRYEGVGWIAPRESDVAVYRLYNPNAGDHHYTTSESERRSLIEAGWSNEGIGWFSDSESGVGLYRLYNPNAISGAHHYTESGSERDMLMRCGWSFEGIGWYGVSR